jgi:Leucine-rich repeat (LRR) protein
LDVFPNLEHFYWKINEHFYWKEEKIVADFVSHKSDMLRTFKFCSDGSIENSFANVINTFSNSLEALKIICSKVESIQLDLFVNLKYLEISPGPRSIAAQLKPLKNLKILKCLDLTNCSFEENFLEGLINLECLRLYTVGNFKFSSIKYLLNLKTLYIHGARSVEFDLKKEEEFFPNLTHLDLRLTDIKVLGKDAFSSFKSLETLEFSFNEIHEIDKNVFDGLEKLRVLTFYDYGHTENLLTALENLKSINKCVTINH